MRARSTRNGATPIAAGISLAAIASPSIIRPVNASTMPESQVTVRLPAVSAYAASPG